jgi:prophage regulatory protein
VYVASAYLDQHELIIKHEDTSIEIRLGENLMNHTYLTTDIGEKNFMRKLAMIELLARLIIVKAKRKGRRYPNGRTLRRARRVDWVRQASRRSAGTGREADYRRMREMESLMTEVRPHRLIRERDLPSYAGLKRTQITELIKRGEFPRPIKLSDGGRAKAWLEDELLLWQRHRLAKRDID